MSIEQSVAEVQLRWVENWKSFRIWKCDKNKNNNPNNNKTQQQQQQRL